MARKGGNPDIVKYSFRKGESRCAEAAKKAHESRARHFSAFQSVRSIVETAVPAESLNESIVSFWKSRGVEKENISPMMAEIAPIYADALKNHDIAVLERVYKLLGLTFESNREHNINVSLGNKEDKPFEINYIIGGKKVDPNEIATDG